MRTLSTLDTFNDCTARTHDSIVIAGGGLAAFFSAYEILRQAREAGRQISVLVLADELSAPCTAGSHAVLEIEGLFADAVPNRDKISNLLRGGFDSLRETIARERIDCRFSMGYEVKGKTRAALDGLRDSMLARGMYTAADIIPDNAAGAVFDLPGHPFSASIAGIGQVNTPELIAGVADAFKKMGGTLLTGVRYEGQKRNPDGTYTVHTTRGDFHARRRPLLATGAEHQLSLPEMKPFDAQLVYTMGLVLGPLDAADFRRISGGRPMAVCNTDLDGDVLWGGVDEKGMLTMGRGDLASPSGRDALLGELKTMLDDMYPGITARYPPEISFGAMMVTPSRMPVVGRLENFDVMGGWAGMGIVAGYAAATGYARWVVHGDERDLAIFEGMHPGRFAGPTAAAAARAPRATGWT